MTMAVAGPLGLSEAAKEEGRERTRLSTILPPSLTGVMEIVVENRPLLRQTFNAAAAAGGLSGGQGSTLHSSRHTAHGLSAHPEEDSNAHRSYLCPLLEGKEESITRQK